MTRNVRIPLFIMTSGMLRDDISALLHRDGIFSEIKKVIAKIALMSFYVPVRYYVLLTAAQTSHISHTCLFPARLPAGCPSNAWLMSADSQNMATNTIQRPTDLSSYK